MLLRLMYVYFQKYKNECCLNPNDPFGAFETYDKVFVAVSGTVTFESLRVGTFDMIFQEEVPARTGNVFGLMFRVQGCWHIGSEFEASGCSL